MWKFFWDQIFCPLKRVSQSKGSIVLWKRFNQPHVQSKCKCSCALPNRWLLLVLHKYELKKISRPPVMSDGGNWSPGLWKLATISLFLTDSSGLVGDACIWIPRGWHGCRLWIRGGLIWALLCCHLIFLDKKLPLSSQFFDFVFTDSILQGAKLWWTTYSIPFWLGVGDGGG